MFESLFLGLTVLIVTIFVAIPPILFLGWVLKVLLDTLFERDR